MFVDLSVQSIATEALLLAIYPAQFPFALGQSGLCILHLLINGVDNLRALRDYHFKYRQWKRLNTGYLGRRCVPRPILLPGISCFDGSSQTERRDDASETARQRAMG